MEAIGLLASGLAHDFTNTLAAAGGFAIMIQEAATDTLIRSDARAIIDVVERARKLTQQLLSFASDADAMTRPVDIRAVITGLVPLLRQLLGPETEISVEMPDRPMIVHLDSGQLEQALINLAVNARDAMPKGGQLTFAVRSGRRSLADSVRTEPLDAFVELEVRDSGTGIALDLQDRIFEPFFTTKAVGRGSGLGLAMVSGFAARAGGEVSVESEPGKGTTFAIRLPEARPRDVRDGAQARPAALRPTRGSSLSPGRPQLGRAT
jgi:signal transduction histidine kinase